MAFPMAQMMYPTAGVILAHMPMADREEKRPSKFFMTYLVTTVIAVLLTFIGIFISLMMCCMIENYVNIAGSVIGLMLFLILYIVRLLNDWKRRRSGYSFCKSFNMGDDGCYCSNFFPVIQYFLGRGIWIAVFHAVVAEEG